MSRAPARQPSATDALWRLTATYPNYGTPQAFEAAKTAPAQAFLILAAASRTLGRRSARVTTVSWRDLSFRAAGRAASVQDSSPIVNARPNLFGQPANRFNR